MSGPRDRYDVAATAADRFAERKRKRAAQLEVQHACWWSVWKRMEPYVVNKVVPPAGTFLRTAVDLYYAEVVALGGARSDLRPITRHPHRNAHA